MTSTNSVTTGESKFESDFRTAFGAIMQNFIGAFAQLGEDSFESTEDDRFKSYRFKALPQEVDFRRVLKENKNAEFLLVEIARTVNVNGKNKKERPDAGFVLFINKDVLDLFDSSESDFIVAGESLHYNWGYRWMHQLILDDDLGFDADDVDDEFHFRGCHVNPLDTGTVLKQITEVKKRLKELRSAGTTCSTVRKKYTKEEKKKLIDVTVKVF
jgi:hypothetical protein